MTWEGFRAKWEELERSFRLVDFEIANPQDGEAADAHAADVDVSSMLEGVETEPFGGVFGIETALAAPAPRPELEVGGVVRIAATDAGDLEGAGGFSVPVGGAPETEGEVAEVGETVYPGGNGQAAGETVPAVSGGGGGAASPTSLHRRL